MKTLRLVCLVMAIAAAGSGAASGDDGAARPTARIIYSSDWSGTFQLYSVDPSGRRATGQLTFGRAPACVPGHPCGFVRPVPSPDGRRVVFWDYGPALRPTLFLASADGTNRRVLTRNIDISGEAAWAPDSRRVAYVDRSGIHVFDVRTRSDRLARTSAPGDERPSWSSDSRLLAFVSGDSRSPDLVVVGGDGRRVLARQLDGLRYAWSPSGASIAYSTYAQGSRGVFVVSTATARSRRVHDDWVGNLAWSRSGRWLAITGQGVTIVEVASGARRTVSTDSTEALTWSPDGRLLAITSRQGIEVVDPVTGTRRLLSPDRARSTLGWSPDGRLLAYLVEWSPHVYGARDLRTVTMDGRVRDVVTAGAEHGGVIGEIAWTSPPAANRYRRPVGRDIGTPAPTELVAPWPIQRLVADGGRIVYVACGHVFAWTPASRRVEQAEPQASLSPRCSSQGYYPGRGIYTLGMAGERVAFGMIGGGNTTFWWLGGTTLAPARTRFTLGDHYQTTCTPKQSFVGDVVGSGSLLVFSSRDEARGCPVQVTRQRIVRIGPVGCPCDVLATEPGPFVPHDVDGGRIAATGDNAVIVLDGDGNRLAEIFVKARVAQLSAGDLVVAVGAELRHYDASTGELRNTWPLPERAVLQDTTRGLAAYVLDGQARLLRLSDGTDAAVARGTLARFYDGGLVYADGARLRLVPYDRLPV